MDIGRTLSRAWEITWRWKFLWVLGFLAALGRGASPANSSYRFAEQDFQNGNLPSINLPPGVGGLIAGLACVGLVIAIALWVISVMARGGLIAGVNQVEEDGETTLGRAWAVGQHRFWTLFGIGVLTVLPIIVIVVAMIVGLVLVAGGGAALTNVRGDQAAGPIVAGVFACLCPSICLLVVATALLSQIRIYAERAAILDNLGWIDAFGRGWRVLRDNLGPTLLLWLVFLVLGLVVGAIALAIAAPIAIPLAALFGANTNGAANSALLVGLCGFGLIAIVIGAIVSAVIDTFTSATWTLAYRHMTAPRTPLAPPSEPALEA